MDFCGGSNKFLNSTKHGASSAVNTHYLGNVLCLRVIINCSHNWYGNYFKVKLRFRNTNGTIPKKCLNSLDRSVQ